MLEEIHLTDDTFDQFIADAKLPVVVDFWAPWCGPCRVVGPILNQIAEEKNGRLVVAKMNVDDYKTVAMRYQIQSIPTMMVFKDGKLVDKMIGAMPKPMLEMALAKHLG